MDYRNGNQYHKIWILAIALVLGTLFGGAMEASANSTWMNSFNSTYPSSALVGNCSVCHTSPPTRNSYGDAYRSAGHNFSSIESQDSDGDGFTNIQEINAGTFPGNSSSTPPPATPPTVTTSSLPSGTVGASYSQSLSASGGTAPYSWSVTSGNLPSGLNLSSGGTISGTPTSAGTSSFTVQVSGGGTATRSLSITIAAATTSPTVTTSSLPSGTVGASYSQSLSASGGTAPYSWSVTSGNLPSGLNLSSGGTISGTPTSAGTSSFTVQVSGGGTATRSLSITIAAETPPPPSTTGDLSVTPPDGATNVSVTTAVVISAGGAGALDGATITLAESTPSFAAASDPGGIMCVNGGVVSGTIAYDDLLMNATFTPDCPLANGMSYTVTITPKGDTQPVTSTFTTIVQTADTDQDGVEDGEDDHPNDDTEATPPKSKGEGKFHVSVGKDGRRHLRKVRGISDTHFSINQNNKPHGYEFRDGLVDYEVHGVSPGETVEVTIEYPAEIPSGSKIYMSDGKGFHEINAVISGNRFTMKVTDGGVEDSDGHADGVIVDPVGVAVPTAAGDGSTGADPGAAGGGCSVVGSGGGWKEAAGSYGLLTLVLLGLALRRRKPENGR